MGSGSTLNVCYGCHWFRDYRKWELDVPINNTNN